MKRSSDVGASSKVNPSPKETPRATARSRVMKTSVITWDEKKGCKENWTVSLKFRFS